MSIFRFSRGDRFVKRIVLTVSLILVLVVTLSLDIRKSSVTYLQNPALTVGFWIESLGKSLFGGISGLWNNYINLIHTRENNLKLQKQLDEIKGENQRLRELQTENERLRNLLAIPIPPPLKPITAQVVLRDPTNWFKSLTINKGTRDGVLAGMGVVTTTGVVGRVLKSGGQSAVVQLLTDRNSAVPVLVSRTRDEGILEGTTFGLARIKYLSLDLNLIPGDQVVTSGLTPTFPKGLMIGTISKSERESEAHPFLTAEIVPAVNFSRLEEVLVLPPSGFSDAAEPEKK